MGNLKTKTHHDHCINIQTLSGVFKAMQKYTHVEGPKLPITGTAENFYKFMLEDMLTSCQYAANFMMDHAPQAEEE